jgi:hypothetical protein
MTVYQIALRLVLNGWRSTNSRCFYHPGKKRTIILPDHLDAVLPEEMAERILSDEPA